LDLYLKPLTLRPPVPTPVYELQAQADCFDHQNDSCRFNLSQALAQDPSVYDLLKIKFNLEAQGD
jgi:hypothetical protein